MPTAYQLFKTEVFQTSEKGLVDILIVLDDSGSMGDEQDKVRLNLENVPCSNISNLFGAKFTIIFISVENP